MNFWEQEQEKLKLWWEGVSKREIGTYFLVPFFSCSSFSFTILPSESPAFSNGTASRGAWGNASFSFS